MLCKLHEVSGRFRPMGSNARQSETEAIRNTMLCKLHEVSGRFRPMGSNARQSHIGYPKGEHNTIFSAPRLTGARAA